MQPMGPKIIFLWRSHWTFLNAIVLGCHYSFSLFHTNFDECNYICLFWILKKSIGFSLHLNFHVFFVLIVSLIFASFSWFFHPCKYLLYTSLNIFHIHQIHNHIDLVIVCYILAHFKHIISKTNILINLQKIQKLIINNGLHCCKTIVLKLLPSSFTKTITRWINPNFSKGY